MKRVFKFLGIFIISSICIFYIGIGVFHLSEYIKGNTYVSYLEKYQFEFNEDSDFSFDTDFYTHQLFMIGEVHGIAKSPEIDYNLFKHLHQKTGMRYYMAEVDYSQAYFLNRYLKTGNDSLLSHSLKKFIPIQARDNRDYFDKWRNLYAYNKTLSEAYKIHILGCDAIADYDLAKEHLKKIIKNTTLHQDLEFNMNTQDDLIVYAEKMLKDKLALEKAGEILGDSYFDYWHILKNLKMSKDKGREEKIFKNFKEIYQQFNLADEKIYAYYGLGHVLQAPLKNGIEPLANKIRMSGLTIGENMVSMAMTYVDSKMIMPSDALPDFLRTGKIWSELDYSCESIFVYYQHGIKDLKRVSTPNTTNIYKLDGRNSPYIDSDRLLNFSMILPFLKNQKIEIDPEYNTTDYAQYVILIRNSGAARPNE
ncbi:hypothetical protein [Aquimarina algiphila]|uniref:hypothetical protein n=1 Tax=Aquimarina algiphila TaxID=2047982 RepID=UPI00248F7439|nr:hypothetical protein [Aquimarina algiphila]